MYTLSLTLLLCFSLYISFFALFRWDASWLLQLDSAPVKAAFILIFALFLGAALLLAARIIRRLPEKFLKRLPVLCILLLAAGQLFFLFLIEPSLRYDPLKIFDMAVEMLETHTISPTYETRLFCPLYKQLSAYHSDLLVPYASVEARRTGSLLYDCRAACKYRLHHAVFLDWISYF